jgi:large subunit ribosomal protein L4
MATLDVYDFSGKKIDQAEFDDAVFSAPIRPYLLTEAVNWQRAARRAGTQSALTKAEVTGSTKKPFPQKGKGMARQGSARKNPHQIGGGVAFAPKPRDYSFTIPKSKRRAALACALSARFKEGSIRVLNDLKFDAPKTKRVGELLNNFKCEAFLLVDDVNENAKLSARNHPDVKFLSQEGVNVFDVLRFPNLMITLSAARNLEKRLLG